MFCSILTLLLHYDLCFLFVGDIDSDKTFVILSGSVRGKLRITVTVVELLTLGQGVTWTSPTTGHSSDSHLAHVLLFFF